jgi:hypothetical protein
MESSGSHPIASTFINTSYDPAIEYLNFFYLAQAFLGNIRSWQSQILTILFIHPYTDTDARTLAAFMYGNKAPLHVALAFYINCSEQSDRQEMDVLMMLVHLKMLYGHWSEAHPDSTNVPTTYYNFRLNRLQNLCPPHPVESVDVPTGIAATGYAAQIEDYLTTLAGF